MGKANIYCFYEIILLFKSTQGEKSSNFLQLNVHCYAKGCLRILRPGHKIVLKIRKCTLTFRYNVLIENVSNASYVLYILLIAKSVRHIVVCLYWF